MISSPAFGSTLKQTCNMTYKNNCPLTMSFHDCFVERKGFLHAMFAWGVILYSRMSRRCPSRPITSVATIPLTGARVGRYKTMPGDLLGVWSSMWWFPSIEVTPNQTAPATIVLIIGTPKRVP